MLREATSTYEGIVAGTLRPTLRDFLEWVLWNVWQWRVSRTEEFLKEVIDRHRPQPTTIHFLAKLVSNFIEFLDGGRESQVWAVLLFRRCRFGGDVTLLDVSCVGYGRGLGLSRCLVLVSVRHVK